MDNKITPITYVLSAPPDFIELHNTTRSYFIKSDGEDLMFFGYGTDRLNWVIRFQLVALNNYIFSSLFDVIPA